MKLLWIFCVKITIHKLTKDNTYYVIDVLIPKYVSTRLRSPWWNSVHQFRFNNSWTQCKYKDWWTVSFIFTCHQFHNNMRFSSILLFFTFSFFHVNTTKLLDPSNTILRTRKSFPLRWYLKRSFCCKKKNSLIINKSMREFCQASSSLFLRNSS